MMAHPMHLHGHHFQVVAVDDKRMRSPSTRGSPTLTPWSLATGWRLVAYPPAPARADSITFLAQIPRCAPAAGDVTIGVGGDDLPDRSASAQSPG